MKRKRLQYNMNKVNELLYSIRKLIKDEERFLNILYETVDDWMCKGNLEECDELLKEINPLIDSEVLCLGALTIVSLVKDKLFEYKNFYIRLQNHLINTRGFEHSKSALHGLGI